MVKWLNSAKQRLKFDKFKLQIIKFLTKFAYHIKPKVAKAFVKSIIKTIFSLPNLASNAHASI